MSLTSSHTGSDGLSLAPLRALRPAATDEPLGLMLCPPYDVIDATTREALLAGDPDNAVAVILPEPTPSGYADAARRLARWVDDGRYAVDEAPALFVYEMRDALGHSTRGLLGALELRAPEDGIVLPHENTMAGPVADRLKVMTSTDADLEPIYLVYDGGGAASQIVRSVSDRNPVAHAETADGITHTLWSLTDPSEHASIAQDLHARRALIADGHHRYATYRERQRVRRTAAGPGPWDRGLTLLVDSSDYGPQVHAIHRVVVGLDLDGAVGLVSGIGTTEATEADPADAVAQIEATIGFAVVLTDGERSVVVTDPVGRLAEASRRAGEPAELGALDVTIVHRGLVEAVWQLDDHVQTVHYAHTIRDALADARRSLGVAILLRPTPVTAVAAVAAAGARMPRKSTLFTPKPASGLVMRRLADQAGLP